MPQVWPVSASSQEHAAFVAPPGGALSRLVYRSSAVRPLSSLELYQLTLVAQSRNRAEAITGLMLYDKGYFFQWLEGPIGNLERVMRSIHGDSRHTGVDILDTSTISTRKFTGWSMKLVAHGAAAASRRQDVIEPPPGVLETLHRNPHTAPAVLASFIQDPSHLSAANVSEFGSASRGQLNHRTAGVLKAVITATVIPELLDRRGFVVPRTPALAVNRRVSELTDLLIGDDQAAALELIREVQADTSPTLLHFATLFEPVARIFGDMWEEDTCTEFDVTLGLSRIQTAVRLLSSGVIRKRPAVLLGPQVLIAPEPGELHGLGATLDSEVIWNTGWRAQCEYPQNDRALEDLVSKSWFDVLDLSLSTASRREHLLPRLTNTIAAARRASRNPAMVVVVGGRLFREQQSAGADVGADAASTTATQVGQSITDCLPKLGPDRIS